MKFTVLTPALFAALAASANAATYSLTNAETCQLAAGEFVCHGLSSETTCNADSSCEWTTEGGVSYCIVKETLQTKLEADMNQVGTALTPLFMTCEPKTEAECTGDCAWGIQEDDGNYEAACMPSVAKVTSTLTADGAPEALAKKFPTSSFFEGINCWPKTTEATCGSGCSWDADPDDGNRNCGVSEAKIIGEVSPICGSNGSWEAAAANAGTTLADAQSEAAETSTDSSASDAGNSDTTNADAPAEGANTTNADAAAEGANTTLAAETSTDSSGSADSASRFAVLAASAVAAASLLA